MIDETTPNQDGEPPGYEMSGDFESPGELDAQLDALLDRHLKSLPRETFPADRLSFVLATARRDARRDAWKRIVTWLKSAPAFDLKPAFAMAALTAVTVFAALYGDPGRRAPAPMDPQVAEALEQVRWTLGFVADVSKRTGESVRTQVIDPHVVQPLQDAVNEVFDAQPILN
jgi:hypothetical protein